MHRYWFQTFIECFYLKQLSRRRGMVFREGQRLIPGMIRKAVRQRTIRSFSDPERVSLSDENNNHTLAFCLALLSRE